MKKKITLEELEFTLPLRIQQKEKREMPCPNCAVTEYRTVNYEQRIWRSDDHGIDGKHRTRRYEVSFVCNDSCVSAGKKLFVTNRYYSLREALFERKQKVRSIRNWRRIIARILRRRKGI